MSFRLKTILGIALIESLLLVILVFSAMDFLHNSNEEQLQQRANITSRLFANAIKDAVLSTDLATLESFVEEIIANPDIVYTRIRNNEIILAEGGDATILNLPHHPDNKLANVTDGIFDIRTEIIEGGISYAVIEMGLSTESIEHLLSKARRWIGGIASLEVGLVALFSFILGTYLTRQLLILKKASNIITLEGPGHQISISGNDEISDVAHAFNEMSNNLQQSYEDLNKSLKMQKNMVTVANKNRSELRLISQVFDSSEAMFITDANSNIIKTNAAFTRITGYESAEVIGENPRIFSSDKQGNEFYKNMWTSLLKDNEWSGEIFNKRKNGDIFPEHLHISAHKDSKGKLKYYIAHLVDISEQKHDEEQLRIAQSKAELANEAKSHFLAAMSHEIRTPMNAVLGILGLLKDSSLDETQSNLVRTGRESGELLLSIINDILDFTTMESHKLQLEHSCFDLHKLLNSCINIMKHLADNKNLNITLIIQPSLPRYVKGDASRLRQIIINLINNAIKFTVHGKIIVSSTAQVHDNKMMFSCAVKDTGIGIAEPYLVNLFDQFTMVDQSHSRHYEGTGLGLAICQRLVALMGGHIGVDSTLGKGSTFSFNIELEKTEDKDEIESLIIDNQESQPTLPDINTRILLAEDNPANQMVIKCILEAKGMFVDIVSNGKEAVEAISSVPYDIILMDVSMPEMDGMTATKKIRQLSGEVSKIPIIALTAHTLSGDRKRILDSGMDDYLTKPIDTIATLNCIARWTNKLEIKKVVITQASTSSADKEYEHVNKEVLQQLAIDTSIDIVPELITLYLSDAKKRIHLIEKAIKENDFKTLEFESHTIGSSAAAHGNEKLYHIAREAEHLCQDGNNKKALSKAVEATNIARESFRLLEEYAKSEFSSAKQDKKNE